MHTDLLFDRMIMMSQLITELIVSTVWQLHSDWPFNLRIISAVPILECHITCMHTVFWLVS